MRHILITRTQENEAIETAKLLQAMGFMPHIYPLTQIKNIAYHLPPTKFDGLILTSTTIFQALSLHDRQKLISLPLYVVGEKTAELAQKNGFMPPLYIGRDNQDLTQKILSCSPLPKNLLYLTGRVRQKNFETNLTTHQIKIHPLELYDTVCPSSTTLQQKNFPHSFDAILFYAATAAQQAFHLQNFIQTETKLICLSERIAAQLPHQWHQQIIIAPHPTQKSLLACLNKLFI